MPDITASTALRDFIASRLTTADGVNYFCTLHGSGGSAITAGSSYAASGIGELATAIGYTAGGVKLGTAVNGTNPAWPGAMTASGGVLDCADAVWTSSGTLSAEYCAVWVSAAATLDATAKLVSLKNSSQTASSGQTMTGGMTNPITIPTPA